MRVPSAAGVAPSPWTAKQCMLLAVFLVAGVIGLIAGYAGTSGTLRVSHQVVWVNVAGAALLVSGAGVVLFLTAGRQAIGWRRLGLFGNVEEAAASQDNVALSVTTGDFVAAPTMTKYHRPDCPFVAGKPDVAPATGPDHQRAGRRPCGVCLRGGEGA